MENVEIMLGCFSNNDEINGPNDSDTNLDSDSNRLPRNSNIQEDFRSLLNTNSKENSEMTIETT